MNNFVRCMRSKEYSTPRTPQQNRAIEGKNQTIQEMARTMLSKAKLLDMYWREVVQTTVYILNRAQIRPNTTKTPYKLWKGILASSSHLRIFGIKCYIKRDEENLGKFNSRSDESIFLGYSMKKNAYRCYNKILRRIVESVNVSIDEIIQSIEVPDEEDNDDLSAVMMKDQKVNQRIQLQRLQPSMFRRSTMKIKSQEIKIVEFRLGQELRKKMNKYTLPYCQKLNQILMQTQEKKKVGQRPWKKS